MQKRELTCSWVFAPCIGAHQLRQESIIRIVKATILSINVKTNVAKLIQQQSENGMIIIMIHM